MSKKWETITFDQIKQGDRLKVRQVTGDRVQVTEGVVWATNTLGAKITKDNWALAWYNDSYPSTIKRRIVKAEPLPTKQGSVILVYEIQDLDDVKTYDPPKPFHLSPGLFWNEIGTNPLFGLHPDRITKWEHASIIPTSTLYK